MKKLLRVTTTLFLDWPQHGFALYPPESQKANDFESPGDIPSEVIKKLKGFFRSGQVRMYVLTFDDKGAQVSSEDVTPTEAELAEADESEGEAIDPESTSEPATPPATPPAANEPAQS